MLSILSVSSVSLGLERPLAGGVTPIFELLHSVEQLLAFVLALCPTRLGLDELELCQPQCFRYFSILLGHLLPLLVQLTDLSPVLLRHLVALIDVAFELELYLLILKVIIAQSLDLPLELFLGFVILLSI